MTNTNEQPRDQQVDPSLHIQRYLRRKIPGATEDQIVEGAENLGNFLKAAWALYRRYEEAGILEETLKRWRRQRGADYYLQGCCDELCFDLYLELMLFEDGTSLYDRTPVMWRCYPQKFESPKVYR